MDRVPVEILLNLCVDFYLPDDILQAKKFLFSAVNTKNCTLVNRKGNDRARKKI